MAISTKRTEIPSLQATKVVTYARVSSKEQEKEGFSIPAQEKLLRGYAQTNGFEVAREFVDVETAKQTGRTKFEEMVRYLKKRSDIRVILAEKTDRLYRNLKDWVTIDELDVEIHFVKEGTVISHVSKSSEKFVHGIKVLMAKNYIDNLSEEARKGQQEKASQGFWPTKAPLGYFNITGPNGKKIISPNAEVAPLITKLFELYATGDCSLKELGAKAHSIGLVARKTGAPLSVSNIHLILRNLIYTGDFEWNGRRFQGVHEPLVSIALWERVQGVLDGRAASKIRDGKRVFPFSGLITCRHCGCAIVGEVKKRKYVYYHCTGFKKKCGEPYVRQEVLSEKFAKILSQIAFPDEVQKWLVTALRESHADQQREHEEAIKRLQGEYERLQTRIQTMYVDKLDGRISQSYFDQMSEQWRLEQRIMQQEMAKHRAMDVCYIDEGAQILDFARGASDLFLKQEPFEQRRLLNFVLSNSTWANGELRPTFRQPFDIIAEAAAKAKGLEAAEATNSGGHPVWLGDLDSNQD